MNEIKKQNRKFLNQVLLVSVGIVVIIGILFIAGVLGGDGRTDEEKLVDSAIATIFENAKETHMLVTIEDINFQGMNGMEAMFMKNLFKDISVQAVMSQNQQSTASFVDLELRMNNLVLIEANIYMDQDLMAISMPTLYSKTIYLDPNELNQLMGAIDFEQLALPIDIPTDHNINAPTMTKEQKDSHQELFDTIKEQLLARDYQAIESFDMPRYYVLITAFITSILTEEVMVEEVELEGKSVSLSHYTMGTTGADLMLLMESMSTASQTDEKLKATKEIHSDFLNAQEKDEKHTIDSEELETVLINTEVSMLNETYIHRSYTTVDFTFPGFAGLIEGPVHVELGLEIEPIVKEESFMVPTLDLSQGIDLTGLDEEALSQFGYELTDEIMFNLDDLLGTLGFDLEGLLGQ